MKLHSCNHSHYCSVPLTPARLVLPLQHFSWHNFWMLQEDHVVTLLFGYYYWARPCLTPTQKGDASDFRGTDYMQQKQVQESVGGSLSSPGREPSLAGWSRWHNTRNLWGMD